MTGSETTPDLPDNEFGARTLDAAARWELILLWDDLNNARRVRYRKVTEDTP